MRFWLTPLLTELSGSERRGLDLLPLGCRVNRLGTRRNQVDISTVHIAGRRSERLRPFRSGRCFEKGEVVER